MKAKAKQITPKGYRIERDSRFYTQSGIVLEN